VSCWSTCHEIDVHSTDEIILGNPLPFNILQVRSEQDRSVLPNGVGQLCLSKLHLFLFFVIERKLLFLPCCLFPATGERMCSVNGESLVNSWHLTGDQVLLRKDGSIVFLGRINDSKIIKKLGQKISLTEIETAAMRTRLVENCVAVPNLLKTIKLVLCVTSYSKLAAEDLEVELTYQLQKVLPPVSVPDAVICLDKLNLTRNGKIDLRRLKKKAEIWLHASKIQDSEIPKKLKVKRS
jgi:acyl-CoA synthetase (AMP-forming)/AMP-acid ligase II